MERIKKMLTAYVKLWYRKVILKLRMLGLCYRAAKNAYRKMYKILNNH